MATAPCRACGTEIAADLVTCPHCHVPRPTQSLRPENAPAAPSGFRLTAQQRRVALPALAVLVLLVVGLLVSALLRDRTPAVLLAVHARYGNALVTLANGDIFDWTDCIARINADMERGGWERHYTRIAASDTVRTPVRDFARPSGERFMPRTDQVHTLSLLCSTPHGAGRWSASLAP